MTQKSLIRDACLSKTIINADFLGEGGNLEEGIESIDISDLSNPEDSGLQMPPVDENSEIEDAYDRMIEQSVNDYTLVGVI